MKITSQTREDYQRFKLHHSLSILRTIDVALKSKVSLVALGKILRTLEPKIDDAIDTKRILNEWRKGK